MSKPEPILLRALTEKDEEAFFVGMKLWKPEDLVWYTFSWKNGMSYFEMLEGGNIGYSVAEKYRGNGYATEMVRQVLPYCKQLGMTKLMVSCADDNAPSWKIIEKFGGTLEDKVWDEEENETIRRYWIQLV